MSATPSKNSTLVVLVVTATGLCAGLVVMTEMAKKDLSGIKVKGKPAAGSEVKPAGRFAAEIAALSRDSVASTQRGLDDVPGMFRLVRNTEAGLYLDVVSGEVLFTSLDKLETSQSGQVRMQVRSKLANSYLGWIVKDAETGARRYVINSSALRFVPVSELGKNGLSRYEGLFPGEAPGAAPAN